MSVVKPAHVRGVGDGAAVRQSVVHRAVDIGRFHFRKASLDRAENKHDFGDSLVRGKAEGGGSRLQHIVLRGRKVVRQRSVLVAGKICLINDLIGKLLVIGACDNLAQRDLSGQHIAPVKGRERHGGGVGDAGNGVADRLSGHDLRVAAFLDGNAGCEAFIQHLKVDDLPLTFEVCVQHGGVDGVVVGRFHFLDGVAGQGEQLGNGAASAVALDGIDNISGLVVNLKYRALQQRTGGKAVDWIVIRGLLHDLDLPANSLILPCDLAGRAVLHINGFQLGVGDVPVRRL